MANLGERIIVLIDMDCFYCQVEQRLQPNLQGKPVAVVQYNQWRSGGIIAVNYEARDYGVTRHMRGDEAKEKCPGIVLVSVPSLRGKADTSKYRYAGREVIEVLKQRCSIIERASVDEAYLDITDLVEKRLSSGNASPKDLVANLANTFVVGYCENDSNEEEQRMNGVEKWLAEAYAELGDEQARKLATAGAIVEELRAEIYAVSKFRCSAGISYNKILAKLACGIHKPNRQTILPASAVPGLFATLPVKKVRNLGGKFGNIVMESLGCNLMADLTRYSLQDLQKRFDEKTGSWLYNIARGIDSEPVVTRLVCKSIGASKNFPGKQAIVKLDVLKHWVNELSSDVSDRLEQDLEENERRATTLTVSFSYYDERKVISQSRSCPLKSYKTERIASQCVDILTKSTQKPIINISIATGKFIPAKGSGNFVNFFKSNVPTINTEDTSALASANEDNVSCKVEDVSSSKDVTRNTTELQSDNDLANSTKTDTTTRALDEPKKNIVSFFMKQKDVCEDHTRSNEPISPGTSILGSEQSKKALNRENLKNSFFMSFLKDAKPDITTKVTDIDSSSSTVHLKPAGSTVTSVRDSMELENTQVNDEQAKESEKTDEADLLAQLQEIFPDLDNVDRSVVQLLPIQLQRFANSYLKSASNQKVRAVKIVAKASRTKSVKTKDAPMPNSLQNFFVKTAGTSAVDESNLRKCSECDRMIGIEKYSEHLDFHVAKDLQREMNRIDSSGLSGGKALTDSSTSKRRRSDESPTPNTKKPKGITAFFGR